MVDENALHASERPPFTLFAEAVGWATTQFELYALTLSRLDSQIRQNEIDELMARYHRARVERDRLATLKIELGRAVAMANDMLDKMITEQNAELVPVACDLHAFDEGWYETYLRLVEDGVL